MTGVSELRRLLDQASEEMRRDGVPVTHVDEELASLLVNHADALLDVAEAARDLADIVIWMSGASAFGPEGEAHEGWVKARERFSADLAALARLDAKDTA